MKVKLNNPILIFSKDDFPSNKDDGSKKAIDW